MSFLFDDLGGLALATLLMPLVGLLPGFALVRLGETRGFDAGEGWARCGWAALLGATLLPAIDAVAIRFIGLAPTTIAHLALAACGLPAAWRCARPALPRSPRALLLLPVWWLIVAFDYVDFDRAGALHQSLLVLDLVKHSAVIEAIYRFGLPLHDPFFQRPGVAGYYYYYYLAPAMVRWLAHGLADSRMAFAAGVFWTGVMLPGALWRIAVDSGLVRPERSARVFAILTMLCFVSGADLPFAVLASVGSGVWVPQVDWWSEEVRFAFGTVLWVPHHMTALLACWVGALLLERANALPGRPAIGLTAAAGIAFAACFGMSVWIALAAVPILGVWQIVLLRAGRRRAILFGAAALIALIVAAPQIGDVLVGRQQPGLPLALSVRAFGGLMPDDRIATIAFLIALLPISYLVEFGVFAYGAALYLRRRPWRSGVIEPLAVLLLIAAAIGLVEASFLRSTIINNDFGWRAIWFAELPAMIWTAAMLDGLAAIPMLVIVLIGIGALGNVYDVAGLRLIRAPRFVARMAEINATPAVDEAERRAYRWAGANLPADFVIQANPGTTRRVLDFGLYGSQPTAVADGEAGLFGASRAAVADRIARLRPIFETPIGTRDLTGIARREGIAAILFASTDPIWVERGGPPPALTCVYRDRHVCLARIDR